MVKYKLIENGVMREDGACIPFAPGNRDWNEYQAWLESGNKPDPADVPPLPSYKELRAAAYPPQADYIDAQVKMASTDQKMLAEGKAQLDKYILDCLAVKSKFPKS